MTNTRESPLGLDSEFFNKSIAGYTLAPWFKNLVNLAKLIFKGPFGGAKMQLWYLLWVRFIKIHSLNIMMLFIVDIWYYEDLETS